MRKRSFETGRLGEKLAARYLRKKGYRILAKNYRTRYGEIDIVARDGGVLCFVEVKTRTSLEFGHGDEFIDRHKMRQIAGVAEAFASKHGLDDMSQRFDCVFVMLKKRKRKGLWGWLRRREAEIELARDVFTLDDIRR